METVVVNLAGQARYGEMNGRQYLVVPLTMLVPGVLNGSSGPLYYPPDEVAKDPSIWNHVPIVLGHPQDPSGNYISARDPTVLQQCGMGFVFRSVFANKLKAEGWFDVEATNRVSPGLIELLKNGNRVELSTGLGATKEPAEPGSVDSKGRAYTFIARNYQPDHLAILIGKRGACSLEDGCGVMVNSVVDNSIEPVLEKRTIWQKLGQLLGISRNAMSHDDLRMQLTSQLRDRFSSRDDPYGYDLWIMDVYDKYIVYQNGEKTCKLSYTVDNRNEKVTLADDEPIEVRRSVQYKAVENTSGSEPATDSVSNDSSSTSVQGTNEMAATKLSPEQRMVIINNLLANCNCSTNVPWKNKDAGTLSALSDDTLMAYDETRLSVTGNSQQTIDPRDTFVDGFGNRHSYNKQSNRWETTPGAVILPNQQPTQGQPAGSSPGSAGQGQVPIAQPVGPGAKPRNLEEWLALAPSGAEQTWNMAQTVVNREKENLIAALTANATEEAKAQVLPIYQGMDIPQLRALVATLPVSPITPGAQQGGSIHDRNLQGVANYTGAQGAPNTPAVVNEAPLDAPAVNWANS